MIIAMFGLLITVIIKIGGISMLFSSLATIDPALTNLFQNIDIWFVLYVLGWCAFGLGVVGQPHILTRPMAIKSVAALRRSRIIYFSWYTTFSMAALFVGLAARVLLPDLITGDPELALPLLASEHLSSFFVGIILAGIFSACISTADSQILVCSSTLTHSFFNAFKNNLKFARLCTLLSLVLVVIFSIVASKSVYALVIFSWSILSLVVAPFVIAQCFNVKFSVQLMLSIIIASFVLIYLWVINFNLSYTVNEVLPGFLIIAVLILLFRQFSKIHVTTD